MAGTYPQAKTSGGGGYQLPPGAPPHGSAGQALTPKGPPPPPYNWKPAGFVDTRHPKFQALMDPLLNKYCGQVSISTILSEAGKRFDSLPKLEAHPAGICWLHAVAACNFGEACSYAAGHIAHGDLSDTQVDDAVSTLQPGVMALLARPSSPSGKRKWRGRGMSRGGMGRGPHPPTQM
jgi:hypothetical protein